MTRVGEFPIVLSIPCLAAESFLRPGAFPDRGLYDRLTVVPEGAMKSVGLFILVNLLIATSVGGQTMPPDAPAVQSFPAKPNALTICAGNVPPENMVITATGNSPQCAGSCRARQVEPVEGPVMIICAEQPLPEFYEIESVTSTPACTCLSEDDNAYVIRRTREAPTPMSTPAAPVQQPPIGAIPSMPRSR